MADRGVIRVIKWGGIVPTLQSFPVIVFAYTCHQNVRLTPSLRKQKLICIDVLYSERDQEQLTKKVRLFSQTSKSNAYSQSSTTSVIAASIGSAASVYVLVAITGYLSFGNIVAGNIVGMCKKKPSHLFGALN